MYPPRPRFPIKAPVYPFGKFVFRIEGRSMFPLSESVLKSSSDFRTNCRTLKGSSFATSGTAERSSLTRDNAMVNLL